MGYRRGWIWIVDRERQFGRQPGGRFRARDRLISRVVVTANCFSAFLDFLPLPLLLVLVVRCWPGALLCTPLLGCLLVRWLAVGCCCHLVGACGRASCRRRRRLSVQFRMLPLRSPNSPKRPTLPNSLLLHFVPSTTPFSTPHRPPFPSYNTLSPSTRTRKYHHRIATIIRQLIAISAAACRLVVAHNLQNQTCRRRCGGIATAGSVDPALPASPAAASPYMAA